MKAAVLYELGHPLEIVDVEIDPPREGEVLVRLAASGVCHSDLHAALGIHPPPLPTILGHEGAGVVEEVGSRVENVAPGDHVVLTWLPYCGHCRMCARGRLNLCQNLAWSDAGTMMDGTIRFHRDGTRIHHYTTSSFAEYSVVPAQTAVRVDPDLPLAELALVGCAVMTGFGAVVNTAAVRPGDTVAVVGCGGVGLNIVQSAAIVGAAVIVAVDGAPTKLELARRLGATHAVIASESDVCEQVRALAGGGVDHAFEALGRPETIDLAVRLPGAGGQAILVGMAPPDARIAFDALTTTVEERTIRGCWYGSTRPPVDVPAIVDLYRKGKLQLDPLVTPCSLEDVNDAFTAMEAGNVARSVIVFETQ